MHFCSPNCLPNGIMGKSNSKLEGPVAVDLEQGEARSQNDVGVSGRGKRGSGISESRHAGVQPPAVQVWSEETPSTPKRTRRKSLLDLLGRTPVKKGSDQGFTLVESTGVVAAPDPDPPQIPMLLSATSTGTSIPLDSRQMNIIKKKPALTPGGKSTQLLLHQRGVTVKFLVQFTNEYDCWEMNTHEVVQHIIRPLTELHGRCAVVLLPDVVDANVVGDASVFISHTWNAKWGTMVAAAAQYASESRMLWLDVFAFRQWETDLEGNVIRAGYDFTKAMVKVMRHCKSMLLVCEMQEEIVKMDFEQAQEHDFDATKVFSEEMWQKVCFGRLWCMLELCVATSFHLPVVIKVGKTDSLGMFVETNAREMLQNLFLVVDLRSVACASNEDCQIIMKSFEQFQEANSDINELPNNLIKVNITMGLMWMSYPVLQAAALGEMAMLNDVITMKKLDPLMIHAAAAAGLKHPLRKMVAMPGIDLDISDNKGYTALMKAAVWGHVKVARVLLEAGATLNRTNADGATAVMMARAGKHDALVIFLETFSTRQTTASLSTPCSLAEADSLPHGASTIAKTLRSGREGVTITGQKPLLPVLDVDVGGGDIVAKLQEEMRRTADDSGSMPL